MHTDWSTNVDAGLAVQVAALDQFIRWPGRDDCAVLCVEHQISFRAHHEELEAHVAR